jgi:hypothetical protein
VPYQPGPGTPGSPGPRRGRALAAVAAVVVVAIAVAAFALLHHGTAGTNAASSTGATGQQSQTHPAGSGGSASGGATSPATGASTSPATGSSTPASTGAPALDPAGTVTAYYAAINDRHYMRAWNLGGRHTAPSFSSFKQGYSTTQHDTLVVTGASGDTVDGRLTADQTDGTVQTYQGTYTVQGGVITLFDVRRIS